MKYKLILFSIFIFLSVSCNKEGGGDSSGKSQLSSSPITNNESSTELNTISTDETIQNSNTESITEPITESEPEIIDTTKPSLLIETAESEVISSNPFTVNFKFSEEVSGLEIPDIIIKNGTIDNLNKTNPSTYMAEIIPRANGVKVEISIGESVAQDVAGNFNLGAESLIRIFLSQSIISYNWSSPIANIDSKSADVDYLKLTASSILGTAYSVYAQYTGTHDDLSIIHYDGTHWKTPIILDTSEYDIDENAIDMNDRGKVMVVWEQEDATTEESVISRYFNGETWSDPMEVDSTLEDIDDPKVAIDNSGNAIAVWLQDDGTGVNNVWSNRFNGTSWGAATLLENYPNQAAYLEISIDKQTGKALVIWEQDDGSGKEGVVSAFFNGTNWENAVTLDNLTGDADFPKVAFGKDGNAMATWIQENNDNIDDVYISYFINGNWSNPSVLDETNTDTDKVIIALNVDGKGIIAWLQHDGTRDNLVYRHYNGNDWGPIQSAENSDNEIEHHYVSIDNLGNIALFWRQTDPSNITVWANIYDGVGESWGIPQRLDVGNTNDVESIRHGFLKNLNILAVYQTDDAGTDELNSIILQ